MSSFNLWPRWAKDIEQVRVTVPSGPHKWFHTPSLTHHPGMNKWWKLFRIGVAAHQRYMLKENDKTIGWNIWFYFRGGSALCFEFAIVRGLPRIPQ